MVVVVRSALMEIIPSRASAWVEWWKVRSFHIRAARQLKDDERELRRSGPRALRESNKEFKDFQRRASQELKADERETRRHLRQCARQLRSDTWDQRMELFEARLDLAKRHLFHREG